MPRKEQDSDDEKNSCNVLLSERLSRLPPSDTKSASVQTGAWFDDPQLDQ